MEHVSFIHDKQDHFDNLLTDIKEQLVSMEQTGQETQVLNADFNIQTSPSLDFEDTVKSQKSPGIQIADLLAGFISRYVYSCLYKNEKIDDIYHDIWKVLSNLFSPSNGIGINMVVPQTYLDKRFF